MPVIVENDLQYSYTFQDEELSGDAFPMDSAVIYGSPAALARMNDVQMQPPAAENQLQQAENQIRLRKTQAEAREAENEKRMAWIRQQNAARSRRAQPVSVVSPISVRRCRAYDVTGRRLFRLPGAGRPGSSAKGPHGPGFGRRPPAGRAR